MKKNMMLDLNKALLKEWTFIYKNHQFIIESTMREEKVFIDGELVAHKKHASLFTQIKRYETLKVNMPATDEQVIVKIGGHNSLTCIVKVKKEVIFYDKSKISLSFWDNKKPILAFIEEALEKEETLGSLTLPDEDYYYLDKDEPRYALGLRLQYTELSEFAESESKNLLKKLHRQLENPTLKNREALYEKVMDEDYIEYDRYFIELAKLETFDEIALKEEAMWFIEHATHRYAFIFGLTILRFTDCKDQLPLLKKIALHEDFTLYVLDIIGKMPNANEQIFELAKKVTLWGRIFAVNLLKADTSEKVNWLITDGYKGIYPELFADKANIMHVLEKDRITLEQYQGIALLFIDMIERQGIDSYDRSSEALVTFMKQAQYHVNDLPTLYPIAIIQLFLQETDWEERFAHDWKPIDRILIEKEMQAILDKFDWRSQVFEHLKTDDTLDIPITIARAFDIKITDILLEKIHQGLFDDSVYDALMDTGDIQVANEVVTYIEKNIDIFKATENQAQCIYSVVHLLSNYEGLGIQLLENLLDLDEPSIEFAVVETFADWSDVSELTDAVKDKLIRIKKESDDKELKKMIQLILVK
ncbi:MAG: hypothetical protein KBT36_16975 [Kurthia sp.]|nr:hypothetical protein [Candidatus Kurthia equi]